MQFFTQPPPQFASNYTEMAGQHVTGQKGKQGWNSSAARPTALSLKKGFKQKYIPSLQDYDSSRWSSIERSSPIPATDISERSNQLRTQLDPRGHLFDVLGMQAPIKRAPDPPVGVQGRGKRERTLLLSRASAPARCATPTLLLNVSLPSLRPTSELSGIASVEPLSSLPSVEKDALNLPSVEKDDVNLPSVDKDVLNHDVLARTFSEPARILRWLGRANDARPDTQTSPGQFCCLPRTRSSLNLLFPDASARCERSPKRALGRGIHLAPLMLSSPAPRSDGGSPHSLLPSPSPHGLPPSPVVCIW